MCVILPLPETIEGFANPSGPFAKYNEMYSANKEALEILKSDPFGILIHLMDELVHAVKDLGMKALCLEPWLHKIHSNDKLYYPIYAKCVELDIPVWIHSSLNFVPQLKMDFGRPLYLDEVAGHFPELKIVAGHGGWPWVNELMAVLWRHDNVFMDISAIHPAYMTKPGSGWESLLCYGNSLLQETTLLLDVGANEKKVHPSPLMSNVKTLGVDLLDLDGIEISHIHQDHVGGIREEKQKKFSLSRGLVKLPRIPVWTPEKLSWSGHNPDPFPQLVTRPLLIRKGIALTGPLPSSLFLLGYTLEQALVFNVEKKGLVIVIGCGHPTIQIILNRAKKLFDEPIYGIIGGLHLPVKGGRMNIGPLNLQNLVGSNRMPWNCLNKKDVLKTIRIIQKESPGFVALSPHDSSDWAIDLFQQAFGHRYRAIEVGAPLEI